MVGTHLRKTRSVVMGLCVIWHWLRSSFWFVPSLMIITAALLSYITLRVDEVLPDYEDTASVERHAWMIKRGSDVGLPEAEDRKDVEVRFKKVLDTIAKKR